MTTTKHITTALAVLVSIVCAAMAAAAAADRAVTSADQLMLTAAAVALALGSHLIPTLAPRNALGYVLFAGCIAATVYNHAHYFERQQHRTGQHRAETTPTSAATSALQAELQANTARALPTVAAELAKAIAQAAHAAANLARCESKCTGLQATDQAAKAKVAALNDERTAALRANEIRHQLATLATTADTSRTSAAQNPVDTVIAGITGMSVSQVGFASAVVQSLMLEVMAAILWAIALAGKTATAEVLAKSAEIGQTTPSTTTTAITAPETSLAKSQEAGQTPPAEAPAPTKQTRKTKPRDSPQPKLALVRRRKPPTTQPQLLGA